MADDQGWQRRPGTDAAAGHQAARRTGIGRVDGAKFVEEGDQDGGKDRLDNGLSPVPGRQEETLAFVLGFLLSGIALGIYFRSWVDLIVPTAIWLALIATPGDAGFWVGAVIGGLWGLLRAVNSNERLAAAGVP